MFRKYTCPSSVTCDHAIVAIKRCCGTPPFTCTMNRIFLYLAGLVSVMIGNSVLFCTFFGLESSDLRRDSVYVDSLIIPCKLKTLSRSVYENSLNISLSETLTLNLYPDSVHKNALNVSWITKHVSNTWKLRIDEQAPSSVHYDIFSNAPFLQADFPYPLVYYDTINHTYFEKTPGFGRKAGFRDAMCDPKNNQATSLVPFCRCNRMAGDVSVPLITMSNVVIHVYLQGTTDFDSLTTVVDALLITQNLAIVKVWIWASNAQNGSSEFLGMYKDLLDAGVVAFKNWDWALEIADSPLGKEAGKNGTYGMHDIEDIPPSGRSDIFRYLVLYKYGGVYIDDDVVLTRDILYFVASDCEWGAAWPLDTGPNGSWINGCFNNHVVILRKGSPSAKFLLKSVAKYPWWRPELWPVRPASGQTQWAYNDGVTQYCMSRPSECRLHHLPMFLTDHHFHGKCWDHPILHSEGDCNNRSKTIELVRYELTLSLRLVALHRHVPRKARCGLPKPFGNATSPDGVMFRAMYNAVRCRPGQSKVDLSCLPTSPMSLKTLLLE